MSDEGRAMVHDLSHLRVGGAPDPPSNELNSGRKLKRVLSPLLGTRINEND